MGIPNWILDLDKTEYNDGRVYNIYQCGTCILNHYSDSRRKGRFRIILVKGKEVKLTQCACDERLPFVIKYKKCFWCGKEVYGINIIRGKCDNCKNDPKYKNMPKPTFSKTKTINEPKTYYRMNKPIESLTDIQDPNKYNCINRNNCLEITKKPGGSRVMLGCCDCPDYNTSEIF